MGSDMSQGWKINRGRLYKASQGILSGLDFNLNLTKQKQQMNKMRRCGRRRRWGRDTGDGKK